MLVKIYQKLILACIIGGVISSCAPQYTAHFSQKSHEMSKYEIQDLTPWEQVAFTDAELKMIKEDISIKEIVIESDLEKLSKDSDTEIIRPSSKEELMNALKENPNATIALQLNGKEKRALKREVKEQLKESKDAAGVMQYNRSESKLLYYILAVLLPPLAVGLWRGIGSDFWINILLTLLFYLPGIIHAIIVISSKPKMTRPATM